MLKSIFAKESPQIRARRWASKYPHDRNNAAQPPKRASGSKRTIEKGGAGGPPPRLFASGLSLEKAWIPRPGPGGKPRRRSGPATVPTEPPTDDGAPPALTSLARLGTGHQKNFPPYPRDTEGKNRSVCIPGRLCRVTKVGAFGGYRIVQTACSYGCLQLKGVFDLFCFGTADDIITEPQIIAVA